MLGTACCTCLRDHVPDIAITVGRHGRGLETHLNPQGILGAGDGRVSFRGDRSHSSRPFIILPRMGLAAGGIFKPGPPRLWPGRESKDSGDRSGVQLTDRHAVEGRGLCRRLSTRRAIKQDLERLADQVPAIYVHGRVYANVVCSR